MSWQEIRVSVSGDQESTTAELFESLGALAVTTEGNSSEPWLEAGLPTPPQWSDVTVIGLFSRSVDADALTAKVSTALGGLPALRSVLEDRDWEREHLQHFKPIHVGQDFWVVPSFAETKVEARYQLKLDPGLAFGTGSHETTAMCLDWLTRQDVRGKRIVDFGCGSGILAIGALILGAEHAWGVDIDPRALPAAADNAEVNGVAAKLDLAITPDFPDDITGDIVIANILAGTLVDLQPQLSKLVRPGGRLLLSGILAQQTDAVTSAFAEHGKFCSWRRGDWMLLYNAS